MFFSFLLLSSLLVVVVRFEAFLLRVPMEEAVEPLLVSSAAAAARSPSSSLLFLLLNRSSWSLFPSSTIALFSPFFPSVPIFLSTPSTRLVFQSLSQSSPISLSTLAILSSLSLRSLKSSPLSFSSSFSSSPLSSPLSSFSPFPSPFSKFRLRVSFASPLSAVAATLDRTLRLLFSRRRLARCQTRFSNSPFSVVASPRFRACFLRFPCLCFF
mmetsp:Transcript_11186/g.31637  ORF Transcript_11186/g.31637 Transcript_11186/m.31637 type:complete len:213 (-) Transcript_11186:450-1088(-)